MPNKNQVEFEQVVQDVSTPIEPKGFWATFSDEFAKNQKKALEGRAPGEVTREAFGDFVAGIEKIADKANGAIETISGTEALAQTYKFVEQQRIYNDVLATRLAEALDEIKSLNARVSDLESLK